MSGLIEMYHEKRNSIADKPEVVVTNYMKWELKH